MKQRQWPQKEKEWSGPLRATKDGYSGGEEGGKGEESATSVVK